MLQFGDEAVELLATLADATQTVVVYRTPVGSDLFPSPVAPPGGASGGVIGDLLMAHLPPGEGPAVVVNFGCHVDADYEVELPIDRARTRPHERRSSDLPAPALADGVRVAVRGTAVGLLQATIDVDISSDDPTVAAATIRSPSFSLPSPPHRQAGPGPLWRDWIPPPGSRTTATATVQFKRIPEGQEPAPAPVPPTPWSVRALPSGRQLAIQGWGTGGGSGPEALSVRMTLRFDPPPDHESTLELALDELFIFRRCNGELVDVPGPRPGETVDLRGRSLACGSSRIDLVRWEPSEHGTPHLVVRPSRPGLWPDVRAVAGDASASLSLLPTAEEELAGGLSAIYNALLPAQGQVILGLRMLGRKAQIPPISIPLTSARTP